MKKIIVSGIGCALAASLTAQPAAKPKPAAKPTVAAKPAPKVVTLKTNLDSVSYSLGVLEASFFKQQGLAKVDANIMAQAFKTVLEGGTPAIDPQLCDQTLRKTMQEASAKKVQPEVEAGKKFLAENKKKEGVKETASGLQYEVIKLGTGPMPKDTSTVKVHYVGTLLNGTKFDSSRDRDSPAEFPLNGVIPGWTEGVQLMPVGSTYKFYIPYNLAYGAQGQPPTIPGGATLVFEVELLDIIGSNAGAPHGEGDGHNH